MALPAGMTSKTLTAGVARVVEQAGAGMALRATLAMVPPVNPLTRKAYRVTWGPDGSEWNSVPFDLAVGAGQEVSFPEVPCGDLADWRLDGQTVDLGEDGEGYVFAYTLTITATINGRSSQRVIGPLVVRTSNPGTVDVDTLIETTDTARAPIKVVDVWSAQIAAAQAAADEAATQATAAAASAAAAIAPTDEFVAARIDDPDSETSTSLKAATATQIDADLGDPVGAIPTAIMTSTQAVYNVKKFGATGNGSTDDTAAINAALASMTPISVFGNVTNVLYFPAGRYLYSGSIAFATRTLVRGDGKYVSVLYATNSATGDAITFNGTNSGVEHLTISGNGAAKRTGSGVVWNAAEPWGFNTRVENVGGSGYVIGGTAGAINARLFACDTRDTDAYGIYVKHASSTDGMFVGCNVGRAGLSGIRASAPGTQITSGHAWGCGIGDSSGNDGNGIWLTASGCTAVNCEGESNLNAGIRIGTSGADLCSVTGGLYWGNAKAGIQIVTATYGNIAGPVVYNNATANSTGASSDAFAGIQNDGGTHWTISATVNDTAGAIAGASYPNGTPAYPYTGRTAQRTQSMGYGERNSADSNVLHGCKMRKQDTRSGIAVLLVGANDRVDQGNDFGDWNVPQIASAAALAIPAYASVVEVTGTTAITSASTPAIGRRVTLVFTNATPPSITTGTHLVVKGGTYTPTQNGSLTLVSIGTVWYEAARS